MATIILSSKYFSGYKLISLMTPVMRMKKLNCKTKNLFLIVVLVSRDVAAAPQTPQLGGPRPTLRAQVSLKLLFGYVTIFSSADLFTTDLNCRKKLACDIISEWQNLEYFD